MAWKNSISLDTALNLQNIDTLAEMPGMVREIKKIELKKKPLNEKKSNFV